MKVTGEMAAMLQVLRCAIGVRRITYVSGPITTGPRWVNLLRSAYTEIADLDFSEKARKEVLAANESDIISLAERLRKKGDFVIEPASLRMPHWKQPDYYLFWYEVLNQFVTKVVVLDGWEYSIGCANEVQFSHRLGIRVETVNGVLLTPLDASLLLVEASSELLSNSGNHEQLIATACTLEELAQGLKNAP